MTKQTQSTLKAVRAEASKKDLDCRIMDGESIRCQQAGGWYAMEVWFAVPNADRPLTRAQALTAMVAALRSLPDKPKEKR